MDLEQLASTIQDNEYTCPPGSLGTPVHFLCKVIKAYQAEVRKDHKCTMEILQRLVRDVQDVLGTQAEEVRWELRTSERYVPEPIETPSFYDDITLPSYEPMEMYSPINFPASPADGSVSPFIRPAVLEESILRRREEELNITSRKSRSRSRSPIRSKSPVRSRSPIRSRRSSSSGSSRNSSCYSSSSSDDDDEDDKLPDFPVGTPTIVIPRKGYRLNDLPLRANMYRIPSPKAKKRKMNFEETEPEPKKKFEPKKTEETKKKEKKSEKKKSSEKSSEKISNKKSNDKSKQKSDKDDNKSSTSCEDSPPPKRKSPRKRNITRALVFIEGTHKNKTTIMCKWGALGYLKHAITEEQRPNVLLTMESTIEHNNLKDSWEFIREKLMSKHDFTKRNFKEITSDKELTHLRKEMIVQYIEQKLSLQGYKEKKN
ncbi:ORF25 [Plodia interpunctella granulovirus]|uniref:ORF25 n=1 Tax=Plodia interpunctella granulovirus TaxID=262175 RepID=A0A1L5JGZ3_9BBAC|nr:ORF25 [Plodia interpunctella granulovirus]APO13909.1 ORF25 [Plodia interpunctella granulovirus]